MYRSARVRGLAAVGALLLALFGLQPRPSHAENVFHDPSCYYCGDPCCGVARPSAHRIWVRGESLLWWMDGFSVPPLVTTSSAGTSRETAGVLGEPTTTILLGNEDLADDPRSGGRVNLGYWLDPCMTAGVMVTYVGLARESSNASFGSSQFPILGRPFFNVEPGFEGPDTELVAFPDLLQGNIRVDGETTYHSVEVLFRHAAARQNGLRIDWLAGWRFNDLDDDLLITDRKTAVSGQSGLVVGTVLDEFDRFSTHNRFHGGQVGVISEMRHCNWTLELLMKLALGNTHSETTVRGSTTVTVPVPNAAPDVDVAPTGLLAQQTNIGRFETNDFAMIPELGVTLGYDLTCHLRATLGYTFVYWSRVARPGDQIDLDLNLSQLEDDGLVGLARPEYQQRLTDVWMQGLSLGLEYRF